MYTFYSNIITQDMYFLSCEEIKTIIIIIEYEEDWNQFTVRRMSSNKDMTDQYGGQQR